MPKNAFHYIINYIAPYFLYFTIGIDILYLIELLRYKSIWSCCRHRRRRPHFLQDLAKD